MRDIAFWKDFNNRATLVGFMGKRPQLHDKVQGF
jgi:hypothetical protein